MSGIQCLKQDIDLINIFSAEFYNKTNIITSKLAATINMTENIINEEKANDLYLSNLENKITDIELQKIMESLHNYENIFDEKKREYSEILQNNSRKIQNISSTIRKNQELIHNIYTLMSNIELKIVDMEITK